MDLRTALLPFCLAAAAASAPTRAAESLESCVGFIDSLPSTVSTQGNWCLRKDVATAIASGAAITIAANNVTLDCNGFKLGGLAAGDQTQAIGIYAEERQNVAVRNCIVRGFRNGIGLGGGQHLVEDNLVDQSLASGITMIGTTHVVRRNRVSNTGDGGSVGVVCAILSSGHITDNIITSVYANAGNNGACGIAAWYTGNVVADNHVMDVFPTGSGVASGIVANGAGNRVSGNHVVNAGPVAGEGISAGASSFCLQNSVHNYGAAYDGCSHSAGNLPAN